MTILPGLGLDLPAPWDAATLEDVTSKIGSGATPRGGSSVYVNSGPALIRSQNVYDHRFRPEGLVFLSPDAATALRGVTVETGDVLINITGDSILRTALVPGSVLPARVNQHVAIVRSNGKVDPGFLQKWLSLPLMKDYMLGHSAGGTRKAITKGHLQSFPIPLPPIDEQRAIAATLGALDDKIESNRRIEHQAAELIASLASEFLSQTPTEKCSLSDLVEFNRLTVKPNSTEGLRYIDIASVSPGRIEFTQPMTWDEAPSRARRGLRDGDVMYSTVRPGRRAHALVVDPHPDTVASTGFAVMTPCGRLGPSLLATVAGSAAFAEYLESVAHGSAYPAVSVQAMGHYPVEVPTEYADAMRFENATMPLRRRVAHASAEFDRLQDLRDALLPELLSGRIRVPAEEVAQ